MSQSTSTLRDAAAEQPVVPDAANALPIGHRLHEFELRGVIGVGGFGIVYRAFDHSLEREVAIKEYMPSALAGRSGKQQVSLLSASHSETFALGLSSFVNEARLLARFDHPSLIKVHRFWEENGTAYMVMPLVRGDATDTEEQPLGRIRNTKKLLLTAALIMSAMLLTSSFVTAVLIPADAFMPGHPADGRALAYLAHERFGAAFGTIYDISTISILWFAGASALAGLLNLIPRYLPRYGMAPEWARATRPLVLIYLLIALSVTLIFRADVDAQAGAYATGVLVLMTSAAIAVTLSRRRKKSHWQAFLVISLIFVYTTIQNIRERPARGQQQLSDRRCQRHRLQRCGVDKYASAESRRDWGIQGADLALRRAIRP
jgi:hypothetical protein